MVFYLFNFFFHNDLKGKVLAQVVYILLSGGVLCVWEVNRMNQVAEFDSPKEWNL